MESKVITITLDQYKSLPEGTRLYISNDKGLVPCFKMGSNLVSKDSLFVINAERWSGEIMKDIEDSADD